MKQGFLASKNLSKNYEILIGSVQEEAYQNKKFNTHAIGAKISAAKCSEIIDRYN